MNVQGNNAACVVGCPGYDGPLQYAMTDGASPDAAMTTVQVLPAVGHTSDFTDDEDENNATGTARTDEGKTKCC